MRVVLDTGVVVSAILFGGGRLVWLREQWTSGAIRPLISRATAEELIRVLGYPKFQLTEDELGVVLAAYLPFCENVTSERRGIPRLPRCSDPEDQKFLELASLGHADALVSSDRDLIRLSGETPFAILSPADLKRRLGS